MNDKGFVKINRSILDWEWWDDIKTFRLFFYCIVRANYQDTIYKGIELKRGQFLTSYDSLIAGTGLTLQEIRTRLEWLEESGEINRQLTGKKHEINRQLTGKKHNANGSIITIVNYDKFQGNRLITSKQQANNKQITTDKNIKNIEERKEVCVSAKPTDHTHTFSCSFPTRAEVKAYVDNNNLVIDADRFFDYYDSREWQGVYDWSAYARNWNKEDKASGKGAESGKKYNDYSDSLRV